MRRNTSTPSTSKETRSSMLSQSRRPTASASASVGLLKKCRSERITVPTAIFLSSCSTGVSYSCSKRRNPFGPASLSRQSDSMRECTAERTIASCSASEGSASCDFRNSSITS
jgi:hypothetical protein